MTSYPCVCDPCAFCKHAYKSWDRFTGQVEFGCACEDETADWEPTRNPCPCFKPAFLPSDDLYEQLFYEDEGATE